MQFLPLQHPSLSGKSRAEVQEVLERRCRARQSALSGQVSRRVRLERTTGGEHALFFSPSGERLAALLPQFRLAVYAVETGTQLCQQGIHTLVHDCFEDRDMGFVNFSLHLGSDQVTTCCAVKDNETDNLEYILLCCLNAHTGAVLKHTTLSLSSLPGLESIDPYLLDTRRVEFSPTGSLAACFLTASVLPLIYQYFFLVIDVTAESVLQCLDFGQALIRPFENNSCWSHNGAVLAADGFLVHTQNGRRLNIANNREVDELLGFSRSNKLLGCSYRIRTDLSFFAVAFLDTVSGQEKLRVSDHRLVGFCSSQLQEDCALVMHTSMKRVQLWDIGSQRCLCTTDLVMGIDRLPELMLDDKLIIAKSDSHLSLSTQQSEGETRLPVAGGGLGGLITWELATGTPTARPLLLSTAENEIWQSPDGCAVAIAPQDDEQCEDLTVTVIHWCWASSQNARQEFRSSK